MNELILPIGLNIVMACVFYLLEKHTPFKKLGCWYKQIIIGIVFGGIAAFASLHGVEAMGAMINVCDAAPLTAGLVFGAPAGIIAGLIGGAYRWF